MIRLRLIIEFQFSWTMPNRYLRSHWTSTKLCKSEKGCYQTYSGISSKATIPDTAVLEAVRGWDGLIHETAKEAATEGPSTEADKEMPPATEGVNTWDAAINQLLGEDSVSPLLHDAHVAEDDAHVEGT